MAKQDGIYKNYVFQNLELPEQSLFKYITVTICPNWQVEEATLKIGEIGFLEYEFVEAGEDYFERSSQTTKQYNYSTNYFINFIKQKEEINQDYKF